MAKSNTNKQVMDYLFSGKRGKSPKKHAIQAATVSRLGNDTTEINIVGVEVIERASELIKLADQITNPEARKAIIESAQQTMVNQSNLGAEMKAAVEDARKQLDPKHNRNQ